MRNDPNIFGADRNKFLNQHIYISCFRILQHIIYIYIYNIFLFWHININNIQYLEWWKCCLILLHIRNPLAFSSKIYKSNNSGPNPRIYTPCLGIVFSTRKIYIFFPWKDATFMFSTSFFFVANFIFCYKSHYNFFFVTLVWGMSMTNRGILVMKVYYQKD